MNASQNAGFAVLVAVFAYPALVGITNALRRWKDRRVLKKLAKRRHYF